MAHVIIELFLVFQLNNQNDIWCQVYIPRSDGSFHKSLQKLWKCLHKRYIVRNVQRYYMLNIFAADSRRLPYTSFYAIIVFEIHVKILGLQV